MILIRFVLKHLPGQIKPIEVEEMIKTVDKNRDGKISYSEFRVMLGGIPLVIPGNPARNKKSIQDEEEPTRIDK